MPACSYEVERRSAPLMAGAVVGTMCIAGAVGFLASSTVSSTLYTAPVATTSAQTAVAASIPVARQAPVYAAMDTVSYADDVEQTAVDALSSEFVTPQQGPSWATLLAGLVALPLAAAGISFWAKKDKPQPESQGLLVNIDDLVNVGKTAAAGALIAGSASLADPAAAYPIFAQQGYDNPREATGRLVCANCHLAAKPTEIELPQAVLPDQVFEAVAKVPGQAPQAVDADSFLAPVSNQLVTAPRPAATFSDLNGKVTYENGTPVKFVQKDGIPIAQTTVDIDAEPIAPGVFKATIKVPYDQSLQQLSAKGKPSDLNVGAVVVLPEGFTLAPPERIPEKMAEEANGLQFIKYSEERPNILVVGPVPGKLYSEMTLPLLSPDPATNKNVHFGTLPVFVGGNRGRGQLYPTGEKSNNNIYTVEHTGVIKNIELNEKKRVYTVTITTDAGDVQEVLPPGAEITAAVDEEVVVGQAITTNPNVGGFGQTESQIVLQEPGRVQALVLFGGVVLSLQTFLVIKKKQYEQVQLSEMNF